MSNAPVLKACAGFTLVELVVVVAILGILASIGLPLAELAQRRQHEAELRPSLREIRTAIDAYKRAVDEGHIQKQADGSGYPPDLKALVAGVEDARSPTRAQMYFLRRLPGDPFQPAEVDPSKTWALRSYDSPPSDPKPGKDVFDVRSDSDEVGLNGIPYRQW